MHKFIELLESQLGYSEKSGGYTKFGDWYGKNVEFDADYTAAPWCDMYLSWAAEKLGYQEWVGQFAYTVHHAQWFRQQDAWGTVPKPGAIVFFDWSGSNRIDHIDHVGIVTGVEGGRIHTIEGNIDGGVAKRKERDTGKVVGYGYPEKIKARLDREATEKQTVVKPAAAGDNTVVIGPGPDLLAMLPAPLATRETPTSTGPAKQPRPAPKHAAGTTPGKTGRDGREGKEGKAASADDGRTSSGGNPAASAQGTRQGDQANDRTSAGAPARPQAPAPAGRTSPGKHAKAATADTSALAVTPTATVRDLATPAPGLDTPAVLAPVLLAAVAILAHGKARQSRTRLLAPALAAPSPSSRRTPGRRRAPGRRRLPRNAPARDLSHTSNTPPRELSHTSNTPARELPHVPARDLPETATPFSRDLPETSATPAPFSHGLPETRASFSHGLPETLSASEAENLFATPPGPALHTSAHTPVPARGPVASPGLGAESTGSTESTAAPVASTGFPSVTTPVAHVEEPRVPDRRDDRRGAPYRGRRRLHEHAVVESSTLVQDAPPRGRRHRRTDSVATTAVPVVPARPARPTRPTRPARPVRSAAPARSAAFARPDTGPGAGVPIAAAEPPAEPGDILVHSGYRGRRRAALV
ncbi:CHAP domain-containing protein [Streptosporangium sp. NPDC002721]|uniref:CHAP domain-containing protein n=1 Tax=Streptosporangium sp. NPDC002721 TaxID=3366188 RepID=UPI0036B6776D